MASGGLVSLWTRCLIWSVASAGPSTSTAVGFISSRTAWRWHAAAGDRCRTPNTRQRSSGFMRCLNPSEFVVSAENRRWACAEAEQHSRAPHEEYQSGHTENAADNSRTDLVARLSGH